ncbi:MAG: hypothetical protein ACI4BB_01180 [Coprococcus sp.]
MYFLIGLGIILVIVYGNMLFDYIRNKKGQKQQDSEKLTEGPEFSEKTETKDQLPVQSGISSSLILAEIIEQKLKQKQNIFGLPLTLCESDGQGKLVALDQEDDIYIIETVIRSGYDDFRRQVLEDMAAERRRISEGAAERRVYAIICTDQPTEALKAFAEAEKGIRLFWFDIIFHNIM